MILLHHTAATVDYCPTAGLLPTPTATQPPASAPPPDATPPWTRHAAPLPNAALTWTCPAWLRPPWPRAAAPCPRAAMAEGGRGLAALARGEDGGNLHAPAMAEGGGGLATPCPRPP